MVSLQTFSSKVQSMTLNEIKVWNFHLTSVSFREMVTHRVNSIDVFDSKIASCTRQARWLPIENFAQFSVKLIKVHAVDGWGPGLVVMGGDLRSKVVDLNLGIHQYTPMGTSLSQLHTQLAQFSYCSKARKPLRFFWLEARGLFLIFSLQLIP